SSVAPFLWYQQNVYYGTEDNAEDVLDCDLMDRRRAYDADVALTSAYNARRAKKLANLHTHLRLYNQTQGLVHKANTKSIGLSDASRSQGKSSSELSVRSSQFPSSSIVSIFFSMTSSYSLMGLNTTDIDYLLANDL